MISGKDERSSLTLSTFFITSPHIDVQLKFNLAFLSPSRPRGARAEIMSLRFPMAPMCPPARHKLPFRKKSQSKCKPWDLATSKAPQACRCRLNPLAFPGPNWFGLCRAADPRGHKTNTDATERVLPWGPHQWRAMLRHGRRCGRTAPGYRLKRLTSTSRVPHHRFSCPERRYGSHLSPLVCRLFVLPSKSWP